MSGYVLHLPEDESVVLSGPVSRRLIEGATATPPCCTSPF